MEKRNEFLRAEMFDIFGIASVTPEVEIGNPHFNVLSIQKELNKPEVKHAQFVVFPELCITGYTCGDLFFQSNLLEAAVESLLTLSQSLKDDDRLIAVGLPLIFEGRLYNCASVICNGRIMGIVPKIHIPNYQEFYEKRWFASGVNIVDSLIKIGEEQIPFGIDLLFEHKCVKIGVEICEDLWVPTPPSSDLCRQGAEIILNLSATDDNIGKFEYIKNLVASQSGRCRCAYAYASAGNGESSTDLVFSGINLIAFDGKTVAESSRFDKDESFSYAEVDIEKLRSDRKKFTTFHSETQYLKNNKIRIIRSLSNDNKSHHEVKKITVNAYPFIPSERSERDKSCEEIVNIQTWALTQRLKAAKSRNLIIGISGGLDSTLALIIAYNTFLKAGYDIKGIFGVTMPATATSYRTRNNALELMEELGVTSLEIPVNAVVNQHFKDIGHDPAIFDAVYENSYARERTQILMDLANKHNGLVLGTGDMSELALGWCTYNGDHMSMYNVNGGIPKTLVKYIVAWYAEQSDSSKLKEILFDIVDTPISPELIPSSSKDEIQQKTEDLVGPYDLHDFFLFQVLRNGFSPSKIMFLAENAFEDRYDRDTIKKWLLNFYKRFFSQQFKRSCMPDGPKIGSVCLSPRGDWRMPSDAVVSLWIRETEKL